MKKPKVLLGMSGGTDSSVAAIVLQQAGYEVTGVTFRFFENNGNTDYIDDARRLANQLHINHFTCDCRNEFRQTIIRYFIEEYMHGRTPVPCTRCNNRLKWPLLARLADEHGIGYIATGHYVRKHTGPLAQYIQAGTDPDKDQSFFLWGLPQEIIRRALFPLGTLTKPEVRNIAAEHGFTQVAGKKDSMGICFCPDDYRNFLRHEISANNFQRGPFVDENGAFLGWHEGYPFYTIGQRRGLGIHLNRAVFVKEIRPDSNTLVLGERNSLYKKEIMLTQWNLANPTDVLLCEDVTVKIRYRKQENQCTVLPATENRLRVVLHNPLDAIACGQAAVFYRGDLVLGGGIIASSE